MKLSDFESLQEAKQYSETHYSKIHKDNINGFTGVMGIKDILASESANTKVIFIIGNIPTTIGQVVSSLFSIDEINIDPYHPVGNQNRIAAQILVDEGILTQEIVDAFFSLGTKVVYPFYKTTEYEFKYAKSLLTFHKLVSFKNWVRLDLVSDCEKHNPQIFVDILGIKRRVSSFSDVEKAGSYLAQVPEGYSDYYVGDAYGVFN